jgi:uncharacterized protein (DUF2235 family)
VGKNVVVCLDGTGNQVKAKGSTNVVRLFEILDLTDETRQVAYYDPGVGTMAPQQNAVRACRESPPSAVSDACGGLTP